MRRGRRVKLAYEHHQGAAREDHNSPKGQVGALHRRAMLGALLVGLDNSLAGVQFCGHGDKVAQRHYENRTRSCSTALQKLHRDIPSHSALYRLRGGEQIRKEELLDLEKVVDTLKTDIPQIFRKRPHWEIFAEDFKVIDQTGVKLEGLESHKQLLQLLRKMHSRFITKDDIRVHFAYDERGLRIDPFLVARWKFQLGGEKVPFLDFSYKDSPVEIEGEAIFHLNGMNYIDYVMIGAQFVNGLPFQAWPDLKLSDGAAENLKKVKAWALAQPPATEDDSLRRKAHERESFLKADDPILDVEPLLESSLTAGDKNSWLGRYGHSADSIADGSGDAWLGRFGYGSYPHSDGSEADSAPGSSKAILRTKKLLLNADAVVFDVDSTVVQTEGIDLLGKHFGVMKQIAEITKKAMGGSMKFEDALEERLQVLADHGMTRAAVARFSKTVGAPKWSPGIHKVVKMLHQQGTDVYLVSGGFQNAIMLIAFELHIPINKIYANEILFDKQGNYVGFDRSRPTSRSGGKPEVLRMLRQKYGYKNIIMIGDGATDMDTRTQGAASAFIGYGGVAARDNIKAGADWFIYNFREMLDVFNNRSES